MQKAIKIIVGILILGLILVVVLAEMAFNAKREKQEDSAANARRAKEEKRIQEENKVTDDKEKINTPTA